MESALEIIKAIFVIVLINVFLSVAYCIDDSRATVIDSSNTQTNVDNLTLSYYGGIYNMWGYTGRSDWHDQEDIMIRRGDTNYTIPFVEINEIKFYWNEKPASAEISLVKGKTVTGELLRNNDGREWFFRGDTGYGDFEVEYRKTSRIIFDGSVPSSLYDQDAKTGYFPGKSDQQEGNSIHQEGNSNKYYQDINNITNIESYYNYITNNKFSFAVTFSLFSIGLALLSLAIKRHKSISSYKSK